jgi:hypothetical protein
MSKTSNSSFHADLLNVYSGRDYGVASTCLYDVYLSQIIPNYKFYSIKELKNHYATAVRNSDADVLSTTVSRESALGIADAQKSSLDVESILDSSLFTVANVVKELRSAIIALGKVHLHEYSILLCNVLASFYQV